MFKKFVNFLFFLLPFLILSLPAGAESTGNQSPAEPTALEKFFPFIILGLIFYFLLIRPQQRRHKQHGDFLSKIKRGDEILTQSGIFGKIEGLTDDFVILEIADNVRIRVVKSQIASYVGKTTESKKTKT